MPYVVNGHRIAIEDEPRNEKGALWVPLRPLGQAIGATLECAPDRTTVTLYHNAGTAHIRIGTSELEFNGEIMDIRAAPFMEAGEIWVPARFFNIVLGYALHLNIGQNVVELSAWNRKAQSD